MHAQLESDSDVIVIGAGLSGIAAALGAAQQGLRVVLLEQGPRLGGRARSWTDATTGDPVHIGPHIFLSEYPNTFRLLDLLGTRQKVKWNPGRRFLTMVDGPAEVHTDSNPLLPAPWHFVPSLLADPLVSLWDKLSNVPATAYALQLGKDETRSLDERTGADLLEELGVTGRYRDHFWAFMSMAIMNVPVEQVSAAALMGGFRKLAGCGGLKVGFADGGLGQLFEPAQGLIERRKGKVLLNAEVTQLLGEGNRVTGVRLADGQVLSARWVVAALPPPALTPLLPAEWAVRHPELASARTFEPCPYFSVYLWFDQKLTRLPFWSRRFRAEDLNCDFYDFSNIYSGWQGRASFIGSNIILSSRLGPMTDEDIIARTRTELAEYLPHVGRARLVHATVNRVPMAIHLPRPGTERRRPPVRTGVEGLFLAGDWIATDFPSSMESAVTAGNMAAQAVLAEAARPCSLVLPQRGLDLSARLTGQLWNLVPTMRLPQALYHLRRWRAQRAPSADRAMARLARLSPRKRSKASHAA